MLHAHQPRNVAWTRCAMVGLPHLRRLHIVFNVEDDRYYSKKEAIIRARHRRTLRQLEAALESRSKTEASPMARITLSYSTRGYGDGFGEDDWSGLRRFVAAVEVPPEEPLCSDGESIYADSPDEAESDADDGEADC